MREVEALVALVACVDVGSTFTKAVAVDVDAGRVICGASVPTTSATDVLEGLHATVSSLERAVGRVDAVLACSSAGGGLRLAVVGYERAITAEAGHRVGLSAGARVVHVHAGPLTGPDVEALRRASPDVVLLVGGTDGGNGDVLVHNAGSLASARLPLPVVLAGNADAAPEARALLEQADRPVVTAPNVLPRIGVLDPAGARAAIREVFLGHVIGGKGLSRGPDLARLVRGATPDVILTGVEVLADGAPLAGVAGVGDVLVVDVGGATTDVYSVVTPQGEDALLRKEVVEPLWRSRTVEGDLGLRSNATGVVEAAVSERLLEATEAGDLATAARRRSTEVGWVPARSVDRDDDVRLAELALTVALRRHGRPASPSAAPRDLRHVRLVVGSGGVLRHADPTHADRVLRPATSDLGGGWRVPEQAVRVVDHSYVLLAAGLLAGPAPVAAARLASSLAG